MKAFFKFRKSSACGIKVIPTILILFIGLNLAAQKDSIRKNTIRFNITNPFLLSDKSLIFGYERIVKKNQSFSINLGRASFPKLVSVANDSIKQNAGITSKEKGFNLSVDYRWYLGSVNKYGAPRGVYIGPFYSYNYFNRTNNWTLNTSNYQGDVQTDLTFNFQTVGAELGYQFVFKNRISLDMILLGPGITGYNIKFKSGTTLDPDDEKLFYDELNNYLANTIPGYDRVIGPDDFKRSGTISTTSLGFRYMIMVGYRF
jgi:hypothetical protein